MSVAWRWAVAGKHPVAGDFFRIGSEDQAFPALWEWAEEGFTRWLTTAKPYPSTLALRFWAGKPDKKNIVCGVLRASTDHLGRPYPLLIAGGGPLQGWRKHWNLLPFSFDGPWNRMELLTAGSQRDLRSMEQKLGYLPEPFGDWRELMDRQQHFSSSNPLADEGSELDQALVRSQTSVRMRPDRTYYVPLPKDMGSGEQATFMSGYHGLVRTQHRDPPAIVFFGGVVHRGHLVLFMRPLTTDDFLELWNLG